MSNIKSDLVNELRNEKYYLDQDFVRLVNDNTFSYKDRLDQISDVVSRIALINQSIAVLDAYIPEQPPVAPPQTEQVSSEPTAAQGEGDVITAGAPVELEHKVEGQTHAE